MRKQMRKTKTCKQSIVYNMVMILDMMILDIFSNLNDSMNIFVRLILTPNNS